MVKKQRKIQKLLLASFFVVIFAVISPLLPMFTPSANALTGRDIENQTKAWQTLAGIAYASGDNFRDNLTTGQASTCNFIKPDEPSLVEGGLPTTHSIAIGYTASSGDGLWSSDNPPTAGIKEGFANIDISDCTDFAKKLGYTVNGADYKTPGTQTIKDRANKLGEALAKKLNVGWGTAPNYMDYQILYSAFTGGECRASYRQIYTPKDSISNNPDTDSVKRNQEAEKNGQTSGSGAGHYYINMYKDGAVNLHVFYVGSDNFSSANTGYGLNKNERNGTMGCTRDIGGGVVRWWLSQHDEFAKEYKEKVKTDDPKAAPTSPASTDPGGTKSTPSCTIEGIGWIICPVVNFTAHIVDGAYAFVSSLLVVQPLLTTGSDQGIFGAWSVMRNIANVAFVIVFIIIIFSQLTSLGVSNYGIKKMLPRIIVAAILVNLSYWICAVAIDISNILGSSVRSLFNNLGAILPSAPNTSSIANTGSGWVGIAGGLLAGTLAVSIALYVGLSALIPALIAALLAIVTVFLVLTLRQALIILLIVIAPLAFVAYLLPNTEGLFKKWKELLQTLLLMYPIIAGIFGASALASEIVTSTATGDYKIAVQIMGALIAILPLAITPLVMKTAGGLLNRFGGIINNPNKGPFDRMRKGAEGIRKDRQNIRNMRALGGANQFGRGAVVRWGARRKAISSGREAEMNRANTGYVAEQAESNAAFRNAVAGGTNLNAASVAATERALASSINTQYKLETDEVNASKVVIEHANLSGAERQELAMTGSVEKGGQVYSGATMQKAALQEQLRTGSMSQINDIIANSGGSLAQFSQTISQGVASNGIGAKNPAFGGKTIDDIAQGKITSQADVDATILNAIKEGKFTAEAFASMHDLSRTRAMEVAYASDDRSYEQILKKAAQGVNDTPELLTKISGNEAATRQIEELLNL